MRYVAIGLAVIGGILIARSVWVALWLESAAFGTTVVAQLWFICALLAEIAHRLRDAGGGS